MAPSYWEVGASGKPGAVQNRILPDDRVDGGKAAAMAQMGIDAHQVRLVPGGRRHGAGFGRSDGACHVTELNDHVREKFAGAGGLGNLLARSGQSQSLAWPSVLRNASRFAIDFCANFCVSQFIGY